MNQPFKWNENLRAGLIGTVLVLLAGLFFLKGNSAAGNKLIFLSYDLPFLNRPVIQPDEVVMVYMNEASYKDLGQSYIMPWDRRLHARLLDRLTADHARAVVFDIVFSDPGPDPEADEAFARAIKANGHVVLAADLAPSQSEFTRSMNLTMPYTPFLEAAGNHWGFAQFKEDSDFMVRHHYFGPIDQPTPSLGWAAASMLNAPSTKVSEARSQSHWVDYYGPPNTLNECSYFQAIYTNGTPPGYFSNKVVYVGANLLTLTAVSRKDEFKNPYTANFHKVDSGQSLFMAGVELQATVFLNILRGDWLNAFPNSLSAFLIVLAAPVFGLGLLRLRPIQATLSAIASALIIVLAAHLLFWKFRLWFPWMIIVAAQIPLALLYSIIINSVQLYVQNKLYEQSLALYLPPKLVKKFSKNRDLLKPGAAKETITILFSDIANFTSISETMDSDDLAHVLNRYFQSSVANCIHANDGTIVKFIGDAIFAFWNAPEEQILHQVQACEAALRFRDEPLIYANGYPLITRFGLHTGVANVGNFGSTTRVDYTAIGESVNLASRMEGLNKYIGTKVLITGDTQAGVKDTHATRFIGNFRLKGFEKCVEVYELVGRAQEAAPLRALHEAFAEGIAAFQKADIVAARQAFVRALGNDAEDGPSNFYLKYLEGIREEDMSNEWTAEIEIKEK